MKIKLNIIERATLAELVPKEENYLTFKMVREFKEQLTLSAEENRKAGGRIIGDKIHWDDITLLKSIEIPDVLLAIITEKLKQIEKDKKINENNFSLYEKIILNI